MAEFGAGLILAFSLALLFLAGSFTFTGGFKVISATSTIEDYQRIGVAMGLLGIAGGWMLERVAERLPTWFSSRMPKGVDGA